MKRKMLISMALVIIMLLNCIMPVLVSNAGTTGEEIQLNSKLYAAVKSQLSDRHIVFTADDITHTITIDPDEKAKITELDLNEGGISDIAGLEAFSSLTHIELSGNNLTEASHLSVLNSFDLDYLDLSTNKIGDVSAIDQLIDKMLVNVLSMEVEPIIVFTKYDLLTSDEKAYYDSIIEYYKKIGYKAIINTEIDVLDKYIDNKVVVLTGQTGVGKSTLLNKLLPDINQETNDISEVLGRGKHTTRHVELFKYKTSFIADTPGFSSLDITEKDNIKFYFLEFKNDDCKFRDCKHINEIGCKVKEDVESGIILQSRYDNYKKMVVESENINFNNKG